MNIQVKDKAFRGCEGYVHTSIEDICTLIAKGIIEPCKVNKVEEILSFGFTYVVGHYELKAV